MVTELRASRSNRRQFLTGVLAVGFAPKPTWADVGSPSYLSAAARPDGAFVLCGINADLSIAFEQPLPARGHAAAAHPTRPEAVAFARRPGTFAMVIDCITGVQKAQLSAPSGRHFYGHGVYSADGNLLFTTENDYEAGQGRIGVWDVGRGYVRTNDWASGGIGPHDIQRLPGTDILVVANGGIDTHPASGRTKLNIPTMRANLAYVDNGSVLETALLPEDMQKSSIRHLAIGPDNTVIFGMQWEGQGQPDALVGTHRRGRGTAFLSAPSAAIRDMNGYIGSVAVSIDGRAIAATSPRGGVLQMYDATTAALQSAIHFEDVCGVAQQGTGFSVTSGTGVLRTVSAGQQKGERTTLLAWDNHLIRI
ncbi:DUF1513 domain-containing protein [Tateyamaria sp.]|uniref:DUF1513 domain-containing protein n=1 Tax=Tateyamaria sp. TaxID=1929288 RepID=UPI0039B8CAA1